VACATASSCFAVGAPATNPLEQLPSNQPTPAAVDVVHTKDGGVSWHADHVAVSAPTTLNDLACPDAHRCVAVGSVDENGPLAGAVLTTADGGKHWAVEPSPTGTVDLWAVACTSASHCLAFATGGTNAWAIVTDDGGASWQHAGTLPAGFGQVTSVTCVDTSVCLAAGDQAGAPGKGSGAIVVSTDGGATWVAATVPSGTGLLHDVACPTPTYCLAAGTASTTDTDVAQASGAFLESTDEGATWSAAPAPAGIDDAFSVACGTATACAAVGTVWTPTNPPTPIGGVVATSNGGKVWAPPATHYIPSGLTSVACPSSSWCVAGGNNVVARIFLPVAREVRRS
jgi:photosystem II stability/assembly factor-like uncharacterized protein